MIKIGVIADDITGANDTAVQFVKQGMNSFVKINLCQNELNENADVVVIDTDSRDITPQEAYNRVETACRVLQQAQAQTIYKKVDSTLRGNLGAEIMAADDVLQPELVVIAPAFPANHRITVGGYHLLNQLPIELTEIAHAPKSPVKESRIVELLRLQAERSIGFVALSDVIKGASAIGEAIETCLAAGQKWIVFDAVQDQHLRSIASAARKYKQVLWVGSAGLAEQLPSFYEWHKSSIIALSERSGPVLTIAGSVSKVTQTQIQSLLNSQNTHLIQINVINLLRARKAEIADCAKKVKQYLAENKDVVLASAITDEDVKAAVEAGQERAMTGCQVSEEIAAALGEIAANLAQAPLAGMVLTGGDTAIHVCRALQAEAIEVLQEVAVGIPLGRLVGGPCSGLPVVTKAGAFGKQDSLVAAKKAILRQRVQGGNAMKPILGITMGDAAGIGPEIIVKALAEKSLYDMARPVVFGDKKIMERAVKIIGSDVKCRSITAATEGGQDFGVIDIVDLDNLPADLPFAQVDGRAGKAAYEYIEKAVAAAMQEEIQAIVTAPLNKEALNLGGYHYPGHTEILGALSHTKNYSMMLVGGPLKVIHVTTHVAFSKVPELVKKERVLRVIQLADEAVKMLGIEKPRIAVAGLNPHSGENGLFGREEILEITPAIEAAKSQGMDVTGPVPPDTVFYQAAIKKDFDIVVVMYHDQGHIPIKVLGFETGVNVTVGLPCIRTSVDHGTAFAIAGQGVADSRSMTEALVLGAQMAKVKFAHKLG